MSTRGEDRTRTEEIALAVQYCLLKVKYIIVRVDRTCSQARETKIK